MDTVPRLPFLISILFLLCSHPGNASEIKTIRAHSDVVRSLAFTPGGRFLVSASRDGTIKIWDTRSWKRAKTLRLGDNRVPRIAFSADGRLMASGTSDKTVRIWNTAAWKGVKTLRGHKSWVYSASFSPDGRYLASGGGTYDKTIKIWDVKTWKNVRTLKGHAHLISSLSFSPDGRYLASGSFDKTVRIWDVKSWKALKVLRGHTAKVRSLMFSPDGKHLASGDTRRIRIWDVSGTSVLRRRNSRYTPEDLDSWKPERSLRCRAHENASLTFSPDGMYLASASSKKIRIWGVGYWRGLPPIETRGEVISLAVSPDNRYLASGSRGRTIKIWDFGIEKMGPAETPGSPPFPAAKLKLEKTSVIAGTDVAMRVEVENQGKGEVYRLKAKISSNNPLFDGREMVFGFLPPGWKTHREIEFHIPLKAKSRKSFVKIEFSEHNNIVPAPLTAIINVVAVKPPEIVWNYRLRDSGSESSRSNFDGVPHAGETIALLLDLMNAGGYVTGDIGASLFLKNPEGFYEAASSVGVGKLKPGEARTVAFDLGIPEESVPGKALYKIKISEPLFLSGMGALFEIPLEADVGPRIFPCEEVMVLNDSAGIYSGAAENSQVAYRTVAGEVFNVTGRLGPSAVSPFIEAGDWCRLDLGKFGSGWVRGSFLREPRDGDGLPASRPRVIPVYRGGPPNIVFFLPDGNVSTEKKELSLEVGIADNDGLSRIELFLNGRPIPLEVEGIPPADTLHPLKETIAKETVYLLIGANDIKIIAYDNFGSKAEKKIVVRRI